MLDLSVLQDLSKNDVWNDINSFDGVLSFGVLSFDGVNDSVECFTLVLRFDLLVPLRKMC